MTLAGTVARAIGPAAYPTAMPVAGMPGTAPAGPLCAKLVACPANSQRSQTYQSSALRGEAVELKHKFSTVPVACWATAGTGHQL
jgi:hypothetical protein